MASEPTPIGGVEKQETGDNLNLWGLILNAVIDRLTEMAVGVKAVALSGDYTLDNTQYAENESRWGAIRFSDNSLSAAPTVTFPNQTRYWLIINTGSTHAINCVANESVVSAVSVAPGKWAIIDCDGTDMFIRDLSNMGGDLALSSIADIASARVIGNMSGSTAAPSLITVYDEDNMASNSATGLATQQSIKAYVDTIASSGDLATVAGIASEITTVADIEDGTVATNAVTDVAGIASNVTTVAGISGNVTTVAGISANVTTVAGISANVTTVAGDSADIQALGPVSADISTLAPIAANITTVAGISADVTTVATNVADVSNFADKYQISASAPTQRADATALQEGDLYYNTTTDQFNVYDGSAWQQAVFNTANAVFNASTSTDNALARFNGTDGKNIQNSGWTLSDADLLTAGGHYAGGANELANVIVSDIGGKWEAVGTTASNKEFDVSTYAGGSIEPTGNITITFANWQSSSLHAFLIELTGGGDHTLTWTGITWEGNSAPTFQTTTGVDYVLVFTRDGGTTKYAKKVFNDA